jgi:hypothetical protein
MDCGCDDEKFEISCYEYLKRNANEVSETRALIYTKELMVAGTIFDNGEGRKTYWLRGDFDPFNHRVNSGIWDGIIPNQTHAVFGLEYDDYDCEHTTQRSHFVRLIRFYKSRFVHFKEAFFKLLPQPLAEEIVDQFDCGYWTFNDEVLPRIVCKDRLLKVRCRDSSILLEFILENKRHMHQMCLAKWYLADEFIDFSQCLKNNDVVFTWNDGKNLLRSNLIKYLSPEHIPDSFDSLKAFAEWIVTQPHVDIKTE